MNFTHDTLPRLLLTITFTLILLINNPSIFEAQEQVSSNLEAISSEVESETTPNLLYDTATYVSIDLYDENTVVSIKNDENNPPTQLTIERKKLSNIENFTNLKELNISFHYKSLKHLTNNDMSDILMPTLIITDNLATLENLSVSRDMGLGSCSYSCQNSASGLVSPTLYIENFGNLTNLSSLSISGFALNSYEPLLNLSHLNTLKLESANLNSDNLYYISYLTNLTSLDLTNNYLTYLDPLSYLTNLKYLNLSFNQIENVYPLSSLTNLQIVNLLDNNIYDVSALNYLPVLSTLNVGVNNIYNISSLSQLSTHAEIYFGANSSNNLYGLNSNNMVGSGTGGTSPGGAPFQDQTLLFSLQTGIETCIYYPINFAGSYLTDYKLSDNFEEYLTISHILDDRICLTPHENTGAIDEYLYPAISFEVTALDEPTFSGEPISIIYKTQVI